MNIFKQISANNIIIAPYPFVRELNMEAYLLDNPTILKLDDEDLDAPYILDVEVPIKNGSKKGNGRLDILAQYGVDTFAIVELKLNEINEDALTQLKAYLHQHKELEERLKNEKASELNQKIADISDIKWIGVLVGTSIDQELAKQLSEGCEADIDGLKVPIAGITLNRYRNAENTDIYVISDTYFKIKKDSKDYSQYLFKGQLYGKGRLVHAVISDYVRQHPSITYSELEQHFPKTIRGSDGCFTRLEAAQAIYEKSLKKRHYLKPSEHIALDTEMIVSSTQWTLTGIEKFIKYVTSHLQYKIEKDGEMTKDKT